jgi:hypothetical protein
VIFFKIKFAKLNFLWKFPYILQGGRARFALAIIASKEETESIPLAPFSKGEEQEFTLAIVASKEETKSIPLAPFSKWEEQDLHYQ